MGKLGKETKSFIYGIIIVSIISFALAFGISMYLTKEYQKNYLSHDYAVAGYLLNHPDKLIVSAFTSQTSADDLTKGYKALSDIGYSDIVSTKLLPAVHTYRNKMITVMFADNGIGVVLVDSL